MRRVDSEEIRYSDNSMEKFVSERECWTITRDETKIKVEVILK